MLSVVGGGAEHLKPGSPLRSAAVRRMLLLRPESVTEIPDDSFIHYTSAV